MHSKTYSVAILLSSKIKFKGKRNIDINNFEQVLRQNVYWMEKFEMKVVQIIFFKKKKKKKKKKEIFICNFIQSFSL